jgi:DNA polymerase
MSRNRGHHPALPVWRAGGNTEVMDALAALRLQIEWGADEALDETPVDRTRPASSRPVAVAAAAPAQMPATRPAQAAPARPGPVARAHSVAAAAGSLAELRAALAGFTDCPLAATATNLVFADGNPDAGLVLVGEAPGAEEDLSGKPFVGASGQFLDRMLASIGLDRTRLMITNLIPWRPPGNRPPTESEVLMCLPFLRRHLALARPRIVVSLGALSTRALTGNDAGIRKMRGRWQGLELEGVGKVRLLPMLHPAYLLRTPGAKRDAWADLLALRRALDE